MIFRFAIILTSLIGFDAHAKTPAIRSGDLIFQQSLGPQAKAILEATRSSWSHVGIILEDQGQWVVAEASAPVRIVSLTSFISRGKNKDYRVYRARALTAAQLPLLRQAIDAELGKRYDIFFEWSDTAMYCSEFVYKIFLASAAIEIGQMQKFSDLKLNGPFVQAMIKQRLTETGRTLNLNEPIVTPITQMRDSDLDLLIRTGP